MTQAIAVGGDIPALVRTLRDAAARRQALVAAIVAMGTRQRFTTQIEGIEGVGVVAGCQLRARLRDAVPHARSVQRQVVTDRISFAPADGKRYRYSADFRITGSYEGILPPQVVVSPREHSAILSSDHTIRVRAA